MKKLYLLSIACLLICFNAKGQTIIKGEYFVDTDPGFGNGDSVSFSPTDTVHVTFPVDVTGLTVGYHFVYLRVKDSDGNWGNSRKQRFYVFNNNPIIVNITNPNLITGEFFTDTDPGQGFGTPIVFSLNDSISLDSIAVNITGLSLGYHFVYLRVKDDNGIWGNYRRLRFYVYDNTPIVKNDSVVLVQAEYWIDSIPTPGSGNFISLAHVDTLYFNDSIPGLQLDTGAHKISVRVKDSNGLWSFIKTDSVRNEFYDFKFNMVSPSIIREGFKTKFKLTITNPSSVDIVEQYLVIKAPRYFQAEFELISDSINGIPISNVSKSIFMGENEASYEMPLYLGKFRKKFSISYDIYITFPSVIPHENINMSYQLIGSPESNMQEYYLRYGSDSSFNRSLYAHSLLTAIYLLRDSINLDSLSYPTLSDSLANWLKNNNDLFTGLMPVNNIAKPFLLSSFNLLLNDSLTDLVNLATYNICKSSTYNPEPKAINDTISFFANKIRMIDTCNCTTTLNFPGPFSPPLQPTNLFTITSGCHKRCACECTTSDIWDTLSDYHIAIDLAPKPNVNKSTMDDFDNCNTSVLSMFSGDAELHNSVMGGFEIDVYSPHKTNFDFVIRYSHLCNLLRTYGYVYSGQFLGYVGSSGTGANEAHLHFSVYDSNRVNISPSCITDFNTYYPASNPIEAFTDEDCLKLVPDECHKPVPDNCDHNNPDTIQFYVSANRRCPFHWEGKCQGDDIQLIKPGDPNDKVGNEGYAPPRYIKPTDELHYGIFFQNVDTATAPAQVVTITDTLDLSEVDKSTFYLESVTAGEMLMVLPDSVRLQNLDTIFTDEPVNGTYVHIQATFDTLTGVIQFVMTSLDTATLLPVTDPLQGFLPPDTSHFDGNGLVSYKVMPVSTIPDDTVIYNTAHIVFDSNPPIATGTWFNTIDRVEPVSLVTALPLVTYDTSFAVHWSGTDDGAGIVAYDVYVKTSGDTAYAKWLSYTSLTTDTFKGVWDSTYQFYSIAYDSVGNVENKTPLVEAGTTLINNVGLNFILNVNDVKIYPNPTTGKLTLEAKMDGISKKLNVEIFNLLNQKLLSTEVQSEGKKYIKKELDISNQPDGVYFLRLFAKDQSITKKFVLRKR